jgi:hypothetical protein
MGIESKKQDQQLMSPNDARDFLLNNLDLMESIWSKILIGTDDFPLASHEVRALIVIAQGQESRDLTSLTNELRKIDFSITQGRRNFSVM